MTRYQYNPCSEQLKEGGYDFSIANDYHYISIGSTTIKQLIESGIFPPNGKFYDVLKNKPDGLIIKGKNKVKILVESKPSGINTEKDARDVLPDWYYAVAKIIKCNVICVTDSNNSFYFDTKNKSLIKDEDGNYVNKLFNKVAFTNNALTIEEKSEWCELFEKFDNLSDKGYLQKQATLDPQNLANSVWQTIWVATGKDPEKCLYNVVEIFIFKFLSDLGVLKDDNTFKYTYEKSQANAETALTHYAKMIRDEIRKMFPKGEDRTTVINGTIFVNENGEPNKTQSILFKNVLEQFKKYDDKNGSFAKIDKNFKTKLYESFLRQTAGIKALGQYFTPRNVVIAMTQMITEEQIPEDVKFCDPFCGVGGFLLELINEYPKIKNNYRPVNGSINSKMELLGYDKGSDEKDDERTIILAKANALIYFSDFLLNYNDAEYMKEFSIEIFNKIFHLIRTNLGTFGIKDKENYFDFIFTNPPYVTSGVSSMKDELKLEGLLDMYPSNGGGKEGLAIEWIIRALKPNGKAFIVVPDGLFSRQNDFTLRNRILQDCEINGIISLPNRTFYATIKKTYILAITKKRNKVKQTNPVFTYLVSEIGETRDANRFSQDVNDLKEMAKLFRQFSSTPKDFTSISPRCKLHPIERFEGKKHWLIDRDWTKEEKLALGETENDESEMDEEEFNSFINEITNFMKISINKGI